MKNADRSSQRQTAGTLLLVIEEQRAVIEALRKEIAALSARVADLERRLGLNSPDSSKPPPGDGLSRPPRTGSPREKTGKSPGSQKGRKGETLAPAAAHSWPQISPAFSEEAAGRRLNSGCQPLSGGGHEAEAVVELLCAAAA